jgi:hypothetical protein
MLLSIQPNCCDLRDGVRENREGEIPAPEFDELELEAMSMGVCVCGGDGGSGASRRPR